MNPAQKLSGTIASEIRAEMARQQKTTAQLAEVLGLRIRAAQRRYAGEIEFSLDEVDTIATWLSVPRTQLLTGVRTMAAAS